MSWISIRDLMRAVMFLMEREELAGAFNLTAPNPVTNATFTQALARAVHRPAVLPVPAGMLRMIFGAMADASARFATRIALPVG